MSAIALLTKSRCSAQQALKLNCLRQKSHVLSNSAITGVGSSSNSGREKFKPATTTTTTFTSRCAISTNVSHSRVTRYGYGVSDGWTGNGNNTISHTHLLARPGLVTQWYSHNNSALLAICSAARPLTKSTTQFANKTEAKTSTPDLFGDAANLGLFAKFKHMYKKYWYVLIPVHLTTSVGWFGAFYYLSKCGIDVPSILQYLHLSETIIEKVQSSEMGHYAIAYLCYKVATPLRYALTLGGTTISIKYLVQAGHIKPLPSKRELMKMYEDKKAVRDTARNGQTSDASSTQNKSEAINSTSRTADAEKPFPITQCKKTPSK